MIDPSGPEYAINRLSYAPTLDAQRKVWRTLLPEQREHPEVIKCATERAAEFKAQGQE